MPDVRQNIQQGMEAPLSTVVKLPDFPPDEDDSDSSVEREDNGEEYISSFQYCSVSLFWLFYSPPKSPKFGGLGSSFPQYCGARGTIISTFDFQPLIGDRQGGHDGQLSEPAAVKVTVANANSEITELLIPENITEEVELGLSSANIFVNLLTVWHNQK